MEPNTGPFAFLQQILGRNASQGASGGNAPTFGAISGGPSVNGGMPVNGLGPGPTATPAQVAASPVTGMWPGATGNNTNVLGGPRGGQALQTAQNMMKPAAITPAQIPMAQPAPQANMQLGRMFG